MIRFSPACAALALVLAALGLDQGAAAQVSITAVPPATYRPSVVEKAAPASALLAPDAVAHRVTLAEPTATERGVVKALNARAPGAQSKQSRNKALAVGFGRNVPASEQGIALAGLSWQALPDGSRVAHVEVVSPGAMAIRVALTLTAVDPDLELRIAGVDASAPVFGPMPANRIANDTVTAGRYWSPVIAGEVAVLEFHAPKDVQLGAERLGVSAVSHQLVPLASLRKLDTKTVSEIGDALPCETDVKCVTPQSTAFVNATKAVAQMLFVEDNGDEFLCTGQLVNDSVQSFTPYFFAASHCMDSATAARTLNTFWFFDAVACGSLQVPPYVQQTAGAALLARSIDWDWALVRLNGPPPAGATFSAWRAEPLNNGDALSVIHHPAGDLKKFSAGTATGYVNDSEFPNVLATYLFMSYTSGETEGGSSGAGVLTFNTSGGYYEVRGGLYFGANASCPRPRDYYDVYSRLDNMLPMVRDYLTPGSNPAGTVAAVEFYNKTLDHYFLSTNPGEINDLDTGVHVGWERTGYRFLAYNSAVGGASPVCRFYRAPAFGDSHFYSASPAECAATAAAHPVDWVFESPNVFYILLPDGAGNCPANTRPIWRFFNQVTTNHRYTAEIRERDAMRADPLTWTQEGNGPDVVTMCSPLGS